MKSIIRIMLAIVVTAAFTACSGSGSTESGGNASSAQKEVFTLKLGHNAHTDSAIDRGLQLWNKLVTEKSQGGLTLDIYPESQLGSSKEMVDQVVAGSLDLNMQRLNQLVDLGIEEGYVSKIPFLFKSPEHVIQFVQGPEGSALMKKMEDEKKLKVVLGGMFFFPRQFASKKPIRQPNDLNALKMRTGDLAMTMTMSAFGAATTTLSMNEAYTALSNNMIEAVELPIDYIRDYSLFEVLKYLTISNHLYDYNLVVMNGAKYDSLPAEYQQLLLSEAPAGVDQNNKEVVADSQKILEELKSKGMEVIEINYPEWLDRLYSVIPTMEEQWPSTKPLIESVLKSHN